MICLTYKNIEIVSCPLATFRPDPAQGGLQAESVFIHAPDFDASSSALNTRFHCLDSFGISRKFELLDVNPTL